MFFKNFIFSYFMISSITSVLFADELCKELYLGEITCSVQSYKSNDFFVSSNIQGKVYSTDSSKHFVLKTVDFSYKICEKEDYNECLNDKSNIWDQKNIHLAYLENNPKYKARKYHGYVQFREVAKKEIYGKIDIIFPKKSLLSDDLFQGRIIFSHILDHWGGSVPIKCSIEKIL